MTALALVSAVVLLIVNGMFVAAEFSLVPAKQSRLDAAAADGSGVGVRLEWLAAADEMAIAVRGVDA